MPDAITATTANALPAAAALTRPGPATAFGAVLARRVSAFPGGERAGLQNASAATIDASRPEKLPAGTKPRNDGRPDPATPASLAIPAVPLPAAVLPAVKAGALSPGVDGQGRRDAAVSASPEDARPAVSSEAGPQPVAVPQRQAIAPSAGATRRTAATAYDVREDGAVKGDQPAGLSEFGLPAAAVPPSADTSSATHGVVSALPTPVRPQAGASTVTTGRDGSDSPGCSAKMAAAGTLEANVNAASPDPFSVSGNLQSLAAPVASADAPAIRSRIARTSRRDPALEDNSRAPAPRRTAPSRAESKESAPAAKPATSPEGCGGDRGPRQFAAIEQPASSSGDPPGEAPAPKAVTPVSGATPRAAEPTSAGNTPPPAVPVKEDAPGTSLPVVVQSARLANHLNESQVRVGLNTRDFGNIELQTTISQDRVGARITTGHAELRAAILSDVPSLEKAIGQHQLRLDAFNVDVRTGTQAGGEASSGRQPRPSTPNSTLPNYQPLGGEAAAETASPVSWAGSGFSVHV